MSQKRTLLIPESYSLNKESNVYFPESGAGVFSYSDGDATENDILDIVLSVSDLSVGSRELSARIHDWPTLYHLSPQRVDLMRPLKNSLKGDILEIGSGCGAITRYLAEAGAMVTAVEGSAKRAKITAARCRDLDNVFVYCDNFNDFKSDKKFDVVTLIGVLEYANIFIEGTSAPLKMLEKIRTFLKPEGIIIIAIENQLGLKYFAGAPEDHLNKPFVGIENKYEEKGPVTFGRKQLEQLFSQAGLNHSEFLFPFPDYKLPSAVITEHGCNDKVLNLADMLKFNADHHHNGDFVRTFNVEQSLPVIIKNELVKDLSNSFLIVVGNHTKPWVDATDLAYTFSTQRKKEFCKFNRFLKKDKKYSVAKELIYAPVEGSKSVKHRVVNEEYIQGISYINQLETILKTPGWKIEQVIEWATPWFQFLKKQAAPHPNHKGDFLISGEFLDAIPQNFIIDQHQQCIPFDLEWIAVDQLELSYVVFRGLANSFNHYTCAAPHENFSLQIGELSIQVLSKLLPGVSLEVPALIQKENEFLSTALGIDHIFDTLFFKSIGQENALKLFKIEPLDEVIIQVFWAAADGLFFEERSTFQKICLQHQPQRHTFIFQPMQDTVEYLRFDIGDKIGVLNIHSIQLKTQQGQVIWDFDIHSIQYKNNAVFITSAEHFNGKIIQLSTTQDPYFVVHLPQVFAGRNLQDLMIEIEISKPESEQFNQFNQHINAPLSYSPEKELKELTDRMQQLFIEKNNLEHHLHHKGNEAQQALDKLTIISTQIEDERKLGNDLKNDKELLVKEINSKNEQIHQLHTEKENLQATLVSWQNEIAEAEQQKNVLKENVTTQEAAVQVLLSEKKLLEQQLSHLHVSIDQSNQRIAEMLTALDAGKKNINELIQDKTNLENNKNQLQRNLDEVLLQKSDLNTILKIQQSHISDLDKNYIALLEAKDRIHQENERLKLNLNEKSAENKALSEKLAAMNERVEFFIQNYENKNILQVVVNQLKRSKRRN